MLDRIVNILQQQCKINAKDLLLAGISGGPDSLCLLHILRQAGYSVMAVHVNHGLRPEADGEAQVVEHFAVNYGAEFVSLKCDVLAYSKQCSISIEEAARILRYRTLFEQAESSNASAVVVGHTADDQVETILLHLLRGSGLAGLRGMVFRFLPNPWSKEKALVRPFLSTWRAEIQQYIVVHELRPISDKSNADISFLRNRIRHELLPLLEIYNPSVRETFLRMGESLKDDYEFLQGLVDQAWRSLLLEQGDGFQQFNLAGFIELPLPLQRYVLRKAIDAHLPGLRDVGFECIDRGLSLLSSESRGKQTDLIAGIRLTKEEGYFWLLSKGAHLPSINFPHIGHGKQVRLTFPSQLELGPGWQLEVQEVLDAESILSGSRSDTNPFQAWIDVRDIPMPLVVRARRPGDQIQPIGMNGHSLKISDLMINLKLPKRARATWPLICTDEEVLWVPGYRLSHLARIRPDSSKALHLVLSRSQVA